MFFFTAVYEYYFALSQIKKKIANLILFTAVYVDFLTLLTHSKKYKKPNNKVRNHFISSSK